MPKHYVVVLLSLAPCFLLAQDPTFSQSYVNRALLNPALTGLDEGLTLTANHRNQWHRLTGGFKTYAASLEMQFPGKNTWSRGRFGGGLSFLKDREGAGPLHTVGGTAYLSRYQKISKNAAIHLGLGSGFLQKYIDYSQLVFSDQLDEDDGLITLNTGAPLTGGRSTLYHLEGGVAYRTGMGKDPELNFFNAGVAFKHAFPGNESLLGAQRANLPLRTTLHAAFIKYFLVDKIVLTDVYVGLCPYGQIELQGGFTSLSGGIYTTFYRFVAGLGWRLSNPSHSGPMTDAIILNLGAELGNKEQRYWLGYSYDGHYKGVYNSIGGGTHEFSLRCNWHGAKLPRWMSGGGKTPSKKVKCPSPGGALGRFI